MPPVTEYPASGERLPGDHPPVELDLSSFLFESIDASKFIDLQSWAPLFDAIPIDPYIKEGYRYKSIAWFRVKHGNAAAMKEIDEHLSEVNRLISRCEQSEPELICPELYKSAVCRFFCYTLEQLPLG